MLEAAIMIAAGIFTLALVIYTVTRASSQSRQVMRSLGQLRPQI